MPKFKIIDEGDSFFTIQDVPIFEMHTDRGFPCDTTWMNAAIINHKTYKANGYRPTIIVGHNVKGHEKESVGFLDRLVLKGKRLYADLTRVPKGVKEKIVQNSFPSRSVEVLPKSKRILTLALLGGTTPHFALPQMTYEKEEDGETHLFFRSPEMEITEDMKKELYSNVAEVVNAAIPDALTKLFKGDGEGEVADTIMFTDEEGEQYAVPAALAAMLAKAKGVGKVASKVAGKVAGTVKRHPGAAAVGAGGFLAGRATKRKYAVEGYQIDDSTGELFLNGESIGMVLTYEDMQAVGMDVPKAIKKPDKLPKVGPTAEPQLAIDEGAVGVGSRNVAAAETSPGGIAGDLIQPLDRADSEQFEEDVTTELYELKQEVGQLKTANSLISEGRRAEEYTKWLTDQKQAGVSVGDIEKTVEFMMSQSLEQVDAYKKLLLTQPKVAFGKAEETLQFGARGSTETEEAVKQDYEQNKETYHALGVSDKDMKYAKYVRTNQAVGEVQPQ